MQEVSSAEREVTAVVSASGAPDWSTSPATAQWAQETLEQLTGRPDLLSTLVQEFMCSGGPGESYPNLDKVVLWSSGDGALRLRLHVFLPGYADRPHNHRWSFASRILKGSYLHSLYGSQDGVLADVREGREPRMRYLGRQHAGTDYFLDSTAVHSLRVDEPTVSLLLRGPAVKKQYFTVLPDDGSTPVAGRLVWSRGAAQEAAAESRAKQITAAGLERVASALRDVLGTGSPSTLGAGHAESGHTNNGTEPFTVGP